MYASLFFNQIAKRADAVITISKFSKEEIIRYTKIPEHKIHVIYCGCDHMKKVKSYDNGKRPFSEPYVLYVGNLRPHKNIEKLVNGFIQFKKQYKTNHKLLLAGHPNIKYVNTIPSHDDVTYLYDKTTEEIQAVYKHASLFAFISLYEGFGLPPLEALSYEIPVLVSDIPIFRETLEDVPFYCDPTNINDIAEKIHVALNTEKERERCIINGKRILEKFSWRNSGIQTMELYNKIFK
jgi:glycosyltransferase involved in cell wall biosynthesis